MLSSKGLEDIQVIMIPAVKLNEMYLENNNKHFRLEDVFENLQLIKYFVRS